MFWSVKSLSTTEKQVCLKTISPRAVYAIVGDALTRKKSLSIVRMGDGELAILTADKHQPFTKFNGQEDWNKRLGVKDIDTLKLQQLITTAGNKATYFAPSVSGISRTDYHLYKFFKPRSHYIDNFFVNDWNKEMIRRLLTNSEGVFILHREYKKIISNFKQNYELTGKNKVKFSGFPKNNWSDNKQAIAAAIASSCQLILFSAGPGGKIIGPEIAKHKNKIVLDIGNTLIHWSLKE